MYVTTLFTSVGALSVDEPAADAVQAEPSDAEAGGKDAKGTRRV